MRRENLEAAKDKQTAQKMKAEMKGKIGREIGNLVLMHAPEGIAKPEHEKIIREFATITPFDDASNDKLFGDASKINDSGQLIQFLKGVINEVYTSREKTLGE